MTVGSRYSEESPAVQAHLGMAQSIIQRMANNSASCKTWCITLVSALLVVVAEKAKSDYVEIAYIPIIIFYLLDSYYLALEKRFRMSYNIFIDRLHDRLVESKDLYAMTPTVSAISSDATALLSISAWPFYILLALMVRIAQTVVGA